MKKVFFLFIFLLFFVGFVNAQPPFQSSESLNNELSIIAPKESSFNINNNIIKLHYHVHNSTGYLLNNTIVDCLGHVYDHDGSHLIETFLDRDSNWYDFELYINQSIYDLKIGDYGYTIACNSSQGEGGFLSSDFLVSRNGNDFDPLYIISMIFGLGIFIFLLFYFAFNLSEDHFLLKLLFIFLGMIGIFLIPSTIISESINLPVPLINFLKLTTWMFRLFMIYFLVYIIYHWSKKSEKFAKLTNSLRGKW